MRALIPSLLRPYICSSCRRTSHLQTRRFASKQPPTNPEIYDVVIVGGGPAGLGLLAALKSSQITSKLKIALIESQDLDKAKNWSLEPDQFSNRVSSLTPSSVAFLQSIGVWQYVNLSRVQRYQEMYVWDGANGSRIQFDWGREHGQEALPTRSTPQTIATMTENANLVRAMLRKVDSLSSDNNLKFFSSTSVSEITNGIDHEDGGPDLSSWPVLSLSMPTQVPQPSPIAARLLVGADGINSPVRSFAGISTDGWDYNRHGVVATLSLETPDPTRASDERFTAYQRFLPGLGGPIALLPLPDNHATLVWSTTVQNAVYLKSLPKEGFISMVNAAFRLSMTDLKYMFTLTTSGSELSNMETPQAASINQHGDELQWRLNHTPIPTYVLPRVTSVQPGTVASFPLRHRHASTYISPRVALVGDAAHVIHPLAGQGLNLGIGDVAALHRSIDYAIRHGMDIGDLLSLERYAWERYLINAKVGGVCDVLHKMYSVPGNGPIAWARGLGLDMVDRVPMLKRFLMSQAAGA